MQYRNIHEDFFYETSAATLTYIIYDGNLAVYNGKAVQNPSTGKIKINVAQRVRDYLENEMPDFREYDGVLVPHPEALKTFRITDESGAVLETYRVLMDWDEPFTGQDMVMNRPVNTHADPRQKIFVGYLASADTEYQITVDDGEYFFYPPEFYLYFPKSGATYNIAFDTNYPNLYLKREWGDFGTNGYSLFFGQGNDFDVWVSTQNNTNHIKSGVTQVYPSLSFEEGNEVCKIYIYQLTTNDVWYFLPAYASYTVNGREPENVHFSYETNYPSLTPVVNCDWITITSSSLTGIDLYVESPFSTVSSITGTVTFLNPSGQTVGTRTVVRYPAYFAFVDSDADCVSPGVTTTRQIRVRTNVGSQITVSSTQSWLSASFSKDDNTITYTANSASTYTMTARTAYINVYYKGTQVTRFKLTQSKACCSTGVLSWIDTGSKQAPETGPVQVFASNPSVWTGAIFDNIPSGGGTVSIPFYTDCDYVEMVLTEDGTETDRRLMPLTPSNKSLGLQGEYVLTAPANTGSDAVEYILTAYDADGNILLALNATHRPTPNRAYILQPPAVPSAYLVDSVVSGTQYEFNYYFCDKRSGDTIPTQMQGGVYYATDGAAQGAGYPMAGGFNPQFRTYPNPRKRFYGHSSSDYDDTTMTYVELTDTKWYFDFGNSSVKDGLLLPNVKTVFEHTAIGPRSVPTNISFLYAPKALRVFGFLDGGVDSVNLWSTVTVVGSMRSSGMTDLYLPNAGYVQIDTLNELNLGSIHLGKTLRFLGDYRSSTQDAGYLPQNIDFYYLGTMAEFESKVMYAPKGTYHCSDGDYVRTVGYL